ncbi:hypothetical protein [Rugamonas sp.]|uniref:hypothetical protein n=1 Tax=Rugamonas sp. TaxID=1926287 RepID=UPI0025FA140C|nr:hypothetical protein [Rugamonas sp.]
MNMTIKKIVPAAVIVLLAVAAWHAIDVGDMRVDIDGEQLDGPFGTLLGLLFGAGGLIVAAVAVTCAALFVGVLFAGLGIVMLTGMALLALLLAAVIAPFTLPLLIPLGIFWLLSARARRKQGKPQAA